MVLGLVLFYWGGALPLALTGLLIFGALALARPGRTRGSAGRRGP